MVVVSVLVELLVRLELLELLEELLELPRQVDLAGAKDPRVDVKPSCWSWKSCLNLRSKGSGSNVPFAAFEAQLALKMLPRFPNEKKTLFHA